MESLLDKRECRNRRRVEIGSSSPVREGRQRVPLGLEEEKGRGRWTPSGDNLQRLGIVIGMNLPSFLHFGSTKRVVRGWEGFPSGLESSPLGRSGFVRSVTGPHRRVSGTVT